MSLPSDFEREPTVDPRLRDRKFERHQALAVGALALPNLFLRSAVTLTLLYGMLTLLLITIVEFGYLTPTLALVIGVGFGVLQFVLGPWLMDLSLSWLYR